MHIYYIRSTTLPIAASSHADSRVNLCSHNRYSVWTTRPTLLYWAQPTMITGYHYDQWNSTSLWGTNITSTPKNIEFQSSRNTIFELNSVTDLKCTEAKEKCVWLQKFFLSLSYSLYWLEHSLFTVHVDNIRSFYIQQTILISIFTNFIIFCAIKRSANLFHLTH